MMDVVEQVIEFSTNFISSGGLLFGFFIVYIECLIPVLPLSVFIALNVNAFGFFVGVLLSWIATCLGCVTCYYLYIFLGDKLTKKFISKKTYSKIKDKIDKFRDIKFSQLVLVITVPFTPSFLINLLAGLSKMEKEKFFLGLLIGKIFTVIFWGYIGKTLIESLTDIKALIYIGVTLVVAFIISKIVTKKFGIE